MNANSAKLEKIPEILDILNILESSISETEYSMQSLKEKLNPIVGASQEKSNIEGGPKSSYYTCDMAMKIEALKGRVLGINFAVRDLLERVQL
jgi:hypothetical protein